MGLRGRWPYVFPFSWDWGLLRDMNECLNHWLWKRSIPLHRRPVGGPWCGPALPGTLREEWYFVSSRDLVNWGPREICKRRIWKRAAVSIGAPLGNLEGGSFTGDSERQMKKGSWKGAFPCLWELEPGGRAPLLPLPWRIRKGKLWRWASLFVGSPFGNLEGEGGLVYRVLWNDASLSMKALRGRPWMRTTSQKKALEKGHLFP